MTSWVDPFIGAPHACGGTLGLDVPKGERKHTALADVLDSVELAKWARGMLAFGSWLAL